MNIFVIRINLYWSRKRLYN